MNAIAFTRRRFSRSATIWALLLMVAPTGAFAAAADPVEALRARLADGVLRWGGDAEGGAPYQLRDPQDPGRVIGFEVELADAIADAIGRRIDRPVRAQFVQYEWDSLVLGLVRSRDFDCIISGFEVTPDRREQMFLSRPYYIFAEQLVVQAHETQINSLADCRDLAIGTLSGSVAERILQAEGIRRIVSFTGQVEPYLDLELGRLGAVLLDSPIALYYASTNPRLRFAGPTFHPGEYAIALRADDVVLGAAIDDALGELMRDGRLAAILRKWHLWNADQAALASGPHKTEELRGLGFDAEGQPLADQPKTTDAVDIRIVAASAEQWTFAEYAPLLVKAAGMTVLLSVCSMTAAIVLGLPIALGRLYGPPPVRWFALAYVEFFRGIPLLLLLWLLYFGLTSYGLQMPAVVTAIVGFGLTYAAYEAEIYRSALLSVPSGQWEAARALAMSDALAFRRVVFPQAFRTALGPMTNDFVALFKDTSLVSVIAVRELTKEYLILSRSSLKFVELGLLTAGLYLLMSVPLGHLSRYLERRFTPQR